MSATRTLARRLPLLSRLVGSIERLQTENERLRRRIEALEEPHLRTGDGAAEGSERGADGLPIPPAALRQWVTGGPGASGFLALGRCGAEVLVETLARHGVDFAALHHVLDFGCGSGRVIRHLAHFDRVALHGTDYNRTAVAWCDEHLPFAQFGTNRLAPPTRYRAGVFDLVYAFSVFTHLDAELQRAWMAELGRILCPRGWLVLSTHGEQCLAGLADAQRERFRRGELLLVQAERAGRNECGAYHPAAFVRRELAAGWDVVEHVPGGAAGNPPQDLWLLRLPEP